MHQDAAVTVLLFVVLAVLIIVLYTGSNNQTEVMSAVAAENSLQMEHEVLELVNDVRSKGWDTIPSDMWRCVQTSCTRIGVE